MSVSVVIPTRDRAAGLRSTLDALARQHPPKGGFEVVVVRDQNDRQTANVLKRHSASTDIVAVDTNGEGPAAARNAGVERAKGELVLFLGDDTAPLRDDFVLRHAELHADRPPTYAVLGQVVWDESKHAPTPFMRWLGESGIQFAFDWLVAGPVPASRHFYCANVSLKRDLLRAVGGFDERFPYAAVEDVELGARLDEAGVELDYHPELVVAHDHPTTLATSLDRVERVGQSAALYGTVHPERPHPDLRPPAGLGWKLLVAVRPLLRGASRLPLPRTLRRGVWRLLHLSAYGNGHRLGPPSQLRMRQTSSAPDA